MDTAALFERLLHAEHESQVDEILRREGYGLDNEAVWRPLGDMPNNRAVVTNQQTEATGAFVEKIVNGIDALLMGECLKRGVDPKGRNAPKGMTEAVGEFYGVRDGMLANLLPKEQTELAKRLHVVVVGEKASPCYLVIDKGEGQTPDDFPGTFLSLIRENKVGIPFVQGKFNCGGTGALPFCGEHKMQLIVSRRDPALVDRRNEQAGKWGFTIVRRIRASETRPSSMYVYLAPDGMVPRFEAASVNVLPDDRSTVAPRPYKVGLAHGTCVKLYNFQWKGGRGIATLEARYELERFLHSPCLPFRLTETRDYKANYFSTTVAGVWATIGSSDAPSDSRVEEGFPAYADLDLRGLGNLPYRIAVFREDINPRHVPHGVFFTVNGQVHGSLASDFISRHLKFDYLKDHLLVSIDCTGMDAGIRDDFFMASRDRVRRNEVYDEVVEVMSRVLKDHGGLRKLNAARRKKEIENTLTDEEETRNLFSELLKSDPMLARLFGLGDRLFTKAGPGPEVPFRGKRFPSYFRLAKAPAEGLAKSCPINLTCRLEFETDAVNDYFERADSPGSIRVDPPNLVEHSNLWNGRFAALFRVPWDAKPGDRFEVAVTVEDAETQLHGKPFVAQFTLVAEEESKPRAGGKAANGVRNRPGNKDEAPTLAIPELKWKAHDDVGVSLTISHDEEGRPEYFANSNNAFLMDALVRAKEDEHQLVKYWFGYGLLLCALGMQKELQQRAERRNAAEETDEDADGAVVDELKYVSTSCDGIARVIIPMIRTLYRGPQVLGG
ncbi:MAG: hypothetical protein WD906_01665 [Anaerolineales bacterium]